MGIRAAEAAAASKKAKRQAKQQALSAASAPNRRIRKKPLHKKTRRLCRGMCYKPPPLPPALLACAEPDPENAEPEPPEQDQVFRAPESQREEPQDRAA